MLKLLLKKQIAEIFRSYFYDPKKNRARSKAGTAAYILLFVLLMVGLVGGMFIALSLAICEPLAAADMGWLYFALMGSLAVFLGAFGSVFNTYASLYLPKDNDLMLSLPIPVNVLMASRLLTVYLIGAMYSSVVILPAVVVYWIKGSLSVGTVLGGLLLMLLISVFVLTLSCALGWVVAKISLKLKNKSLITVVISLVFFGGYYFFYYKAQQLILDLVANAAAYGAKIKSSAYPLYLFGRVGIGDAMAMLVVSAAILALFALVWAAISRSFLKIATASGPAAKRVRKQTPSKQKSVPAALRAKEFGRFLSSPIYMLNCGLGTLLLPVGGVLLLWKGGAVIAALNEAMGLQIGCMPLLLCALVCLLASMNNMAVPSVSLEGKNFWLMQSLPVTPGQVLRAKLSVQLWLTALPVCFCLVCMWCIYPYSVVEMLFSAFVALAYVLFSALFALFLGLIRANLTWVSETTPIKQNMAVVFTLFGGFVYAALLCAGFWLLSGWKLGFAGYMALFGAATLGLCALLWQWLRDRGCKRLASL